jgi:hypothetical protein
MHRLFSFFLLFFSLLGMSMQNDDGPILLGRTHDRFLIRGEVGLWFKRNYNEYNLDSKAVEALRPHAAGLRFVVFAGTWCSDTRQWLPAFYKVADQAGIARRSIELYFADRNKVTPEGLENQFHIERLPTFVVMRGNTEIGRITETPSSGSIEKDLLAILGI